MNLISDSVKDLQLTYTNDIYTLANKNSPFDNNKKQQIIKNIFKELMAKISVLDPGIQLLFQKGISRCFNNQSQFLRKVVLKCIWLSVNPSIRQIFDKEDLYKLDNPDYITIYKKIFDILCEFECFYTLLWFFFQVPNFINYNIDGYRIVYNEMCDYAIMFFEEKSNNFKWNINDFIKVTRGSTFYYNLVYHGKNNSILISKWNKFLSKITITNNKNIKNKLLKWKPGVNKKIKICFISDKLLNYTSVFRDRIGIISLLDSEIFDVHIALYSQSAYLNEETKYFPNTYHPVIYHFLSKFIKQDKLILLDKYDYTSNVNKLLGKFHIIFYPDIGMKQNQTLLSSLERLAPIQITTWGHSDTSGSENIDYYITSKYFDNIAKKDMIKNNYSEKVVILPSLGTYYYNPITIAHKYFQFTHKMLDTEKMEFNIDIDKINSDKIIIGCLQSYYKFNEEFENTILEIMDNLVLKNIKFELLLSNSIPFNKIHLSRIKTKFKNYINNDNYKIKWYSNLNQSKWLSVMSQCHIMLDPFPFGGCNTSLESFSLNIPVICLPSNVISGRFTYGFYRKMDIYDDIGIKYCIAANIKDYIEKAVYLCLNKGIYYKVVKSININNNKLFNEVESVNDYNKLLKMLVN